MANQFILSDPDLDFALRDGGPNQDFDGVADEIFPEFGTIILGIDRDIPFQSLGEGRSIVEFDLSSFVVPDGEAIAEVRLELELSNTQVAGLGQDGSNIPNALSLYGYTGNGHAQILHQKRCIAENPALPPLIPPCKGGKLPPLCKGRAGVGCIPVLVQDVSMQI